jgi:tetratricopeptide (TPR) repeat protein
MVLSIEQTLRINTVRLAIYYVFFVCLLGLCIAMTNGGCKQRSSLLTREVVGKLQDSIAPEQFYQLVAGLPAEQQDSVCLQFFQRLELTNQFERIIEHFKVAELAGGFGNRNPELYLILSISLQNTGYYDASLEVLNSMLPEVEQSKNLQLLGQVYRGIGVNLQSKKEIPKAVDFLYKSMESFNAANDLNNYYLSQVELATLFFFNKDYRRSLDLHRNASIYFSAQKDSSQMAYIFDGMTVALMNLDSFDKASMTGMQSYAIYKNLGDNRGLSVALNNLALLAKKRGKLSEAEPYLREGLALLEKAGESKYIPLVLTNLGNCLLEQNKLAEAESVLSRANQIISTNHNTREGANIELALSNLYKRMGLFERSLQHRIEYGRLQDSLNSGDRIKMLAEAATRYENKVREAEIERLKHNDDLNRIQNKVILLGCLVGLGLIVFVLIMRHRRAKAILEKEKEILAEKGRTQEAELRLAHSEIEAFRQKILENARMLEELESKFAVNPESFSNPEETYHYVTELYHRRILTEEDWEKFKELFDQVYPGFSSKIKLTYPEISQAELRLALLLKLNLETREIASTLGVSLDTVKKTRQRLRKRLGLSESEKLEDLVRLL